MGLSDWLRVFRALHDKARQEDLSPEDADAYRAGCDELARALMASQRLAAKAGEAPRHALRVARALQVDLESPVSKVRAMTVDLGVGGFSTILAKAPPAGEEMIATMRLPGRDPLVASVAVADTRQQPGSARVAFTFRRLGDADRAALELLVIDTALSQIAS
jgi:hypothetical protein